MPRRKSGFLKKQQDEARELAKMWSAGFDKAVKARLEAMPAPHFAAACCIVVEALSADGLPPGPRTVFQQYVRSRVPPA